MNLINKMYHKALRLIFLTLLLVYAGNITVDAENKTGNTGRYTERNWNNCAGIVTTGNEVFYGRIKDTFTPVVVEKLRAYGIEVTDHLIVNDDKEKIKDAILSLKEKGCELIIATGGMSVDLDDQTPGAIKESGAQVISYGAPVLPGAMFCLAYFEDGTPVMGLPGCVMYAKSTIFDLMLPRIAAGVKVERKDITVLGHGGLCLGCEMCHYPACGFGKG